MRTDEIGDHPVFRPPGEADSLILRVADGCPANTCAFCGMYKGVPYRAHSWDVVRDAIRAETGPGPRQSAFSSPMAMSCDSRQTTCA